MSSRRRPDISHARHVRTIQRFPIKELTLPDFKIYKSPQALLMILMAALVLCDKLSNDVRVEDCTRERPLAQDIFIDDGSIRATKPRADRHRESHLRPRQNCFRQHAFHALPQDVLRCPPTQLPVLRQAAGELP